MFTCDICNNQDVNEHNGSLFTTVELARNPKFWELTFTTYNLTTSKENLSKRLEVVKSFLAQEHAWVLCESCANFLEKKLDKNKAYMVQFKNSNGVFVPPQNGDARKFITPEESRGIALHAATCNPK